MPTAPTLTNPQRRWLKQQAHHLKPLVLLGQQGLTEPVLSEIELALTHHELIKVRLNAGDHALRDLQIQSILERTGASLVQRIGNIAALYRANPKRKDPLRLPS